MNDTKQCSKCKETKPVTEFNKQRRAKCGLQTRCKSCRKQHYEVNKEKIAERKKQRRKANPALRLKQNMRSHMRHIGGATAFKYLPYSSKELKEHIESLWEPWMNWDNYGRYQKHRRTWQVDHIISRSRLIYDSPQHPNFQKCWALSNLRPLCSLENLEKSNKLLTEN